MKEMVQSLWFGRHTTETTVKAITLYVMSLARGVSQGYHSSRLHITTRGFRCETLRQTGVEINNTAKDRKRHLFVLCKRWKSKISPKIKWKNRFCKIGLSNSKKCLQIFISVDIHIAAIEVLNPNVYTHRTSFCLLLKVQCFSINLQRINWKVELNENVRNKMHFSTLITYCILCLINAKCAKIFIFTKSYGRNWIAVCMAKNSLNIENFLKIWWKWNYKTKPHRKHKPLNVWMMSTKVFLRNSDSNPTANRKSDRQLFRT